ncbi:SDR family NAD(P)-dependent oxidoreductase [Nocardia goodfellowii]|uniref:Short-subunit dehydrogenase n=1 Tax=Nocardia goodfellowii TaxID=882446 RepID=A0ABS4QN61_9NOCA|nr:SDR family NAD(P)-dependent oxidoreductase [Nocardia goodfellowii]MBP2193137.1 short-subunit dehydrogenase [Nocardia goodfellowii]
MSKVIAVFGAGSGLGESVARRFGREGFRVALVARRKDRLSALTERLHTAGIEAAAFPADLSDPEGVPALITAIGDHFGRIDVVEYGPISGEQDFTPAAELGATALRRLIPLLLLTPVEVVRALLPEWTARGDGAFLLTHGYSAVEPLPHLSGVGPVMAAARNYAHSLHGELAGSGIYVGMLAVAAYIANSEIAESASATTGSPLPMADPDDLAEHYWSMYVARDRIEQVHPAVPGRHPAARL